VRSFFAAHPRAVSGQESHLFSTLYRPFAAGGRKATRRVEVLDTYDRSARGEILGPHAGPHNWVSRERLCELLDEFLLDSRSDDEREIAAKSALETILEEYAVAQGAHPETVLIEKTPGHLYYAHKILQWWPTARIIELIRDGRDVCVSLQHKSMVEDWAPAERIDQINQWVRAVRHGAAARQHQLAKGRWLSMNYETLRTDTAQQVRRLFAFAGLPTDCQTVDTILAETDFSALRATGPLQHRRKGVVGDHQNHFNEADHQLFRELAGEVFEAAGYRF
jgi:Sulfotransferase family